MQKNFIRFLLCVALSFAPRLALAVPGGITPTLAPVNGSATNLGGSLSPSATTVPSGGSNPVALGVATSAYGYVVNPSNVNGYEPFSTNNADSGLCYNAGGTITCLADFDTPDKILSAEIGWRPTYTSATGISAFIITGTSAIEQPGYGGSNPGVSVYDSTSTAVTAITAFSVGHFGNAGADYGFSGLTQTPGVAPRNCAATATVNALTATNTLTYVLTGVTGTPVVNEPVVFYDNPGGTYPIMPPGQILVSSWTSGTSTLVVTGGAFTGNLTGSIAAAQAGAHVCFLAMGVTIPTQAASGGNSTIIWSDPTDNLISYPALDSPADGETYVMDPSGNTVGNISSRTATSLVLSGGGSSENIAAGTTLRVCELVTTNAAMTPAYTLTFSTANSALVSPGMTMVYGGNIPGGPTPGTPGYDTGTNTVASVNTGTGVVTMANPLAPDLYDSTATWAVGQEMGFYETLTVVSQPSANVINVTYNAAAGANSGVVVGQTSNSSYSPNVTVTAVSTTAGITSITLSANTTGTMPAGATFNVGADIVLTATTATGTTATYASQTNLKRGDQVVDPSLGFPSNTYIFYPGPTSFIATYSPNVTVSSGTAIPVCRPMPLPTSAAVTTGGTSIPFTATTYQMWHYQIRVNYTALGAPVISLPAGRLAYWDNLPGNALHFLGFKCATGTDGVNTPSAVTSAGAGTCLTATGSRMTMPFSLIKVETLHRGVTIMQVGDSHQAGNTTTLDNANYLTRFAFLTSTLAKPIWYMNDAVTNWNSSQFDARAWQTLAAIPANIVNIQALSANDTAYNLSSYAAAQFQQNALAAYVRSNNGIPVFVTDQPRQLSGVSYTNPSLLPLQVQMRADQAALSSTTPFFDMFSPVESPANSYFWTPGLCSDGVHANNAGAAVEESAYAADISQYLRN